jgi:L-aminopeptidase/D-esterase-like protein
MTARRSITDVQGVLVGQQHDAQALTGVTVVVTPDGAVGAVDVRGGAPGTRETDLLAAPNTVQHVHAVALCGGSAYGLAAADGVMRRLEEQGIGFAVGPVRVPIVPAAVIFDLLVGRSDIRPDAAMGYAACAAADASPPLEGSVGAGSGASVGKIGGAMTAMRGGVGSWSVRLPGGVTVGALVVVNAFGDVYDRAGQLIAGARSGGSLIGSEAYLRAAAPVEQHGANTTIAVVAVDARLSRGELQRVAMMAHDGMARAIRPIHTPFDGDTVFALATGRIEPVPLVMIGTAAADVLAIAIERAIRAADSLDGLPAAGAFGVAAEER